MASAYYAGIAGTGTRGTRPDHAKWQDAERLVRGLAARLGGTVHAGRPPMALNLASSVYSSEPVPADQVISVLQPYTDDRLFADEDQDVPGAYFLVSEQEPRFLTIYWPPRLSRSALEPPPLALGELGGREPCRWELRSKFPAAHRRPGHPARGRGGGPRPGARGGRGRHRPLRLSRHPAGGPAPAGPGCRRLASADIRLRTAVPSTSTGNAGA